jgi:ankyrin repeat protein
MFGVSDGETRPERLEAAPVYYAALCGFRDVVEKLISEHPEHVNSRGGAYGTALHAAARRNHLKVGQSLLEHGADVNALGSGSGHLCTSHRDWDISKSGGCYSNTVPT